MPETDDPPALRECDKAAKRVYDTLARADDPLSRRDLARRTRYAERSIDAALAELRAADLVTRWGWPHRYRLADRD